MSTTYETHKREYQCPTWYGECSCHLLPKITIKQPSWWVRQQGWSHEKGVSLPFDMRNAIVDYLNYLFGKADDDWGWDWWNK